ncbi:MAG: amidohydrolase family protein [bacterium JZ-2024 1]
MRTGFGWVICFTAWFIASVPDIRPVEGLRDNTPQVHALINARIVQAPGLTIENGTIVLRDGLIVSVGRDVHIPGDARIWNLKGLTIYPGFIDPYIPASQLGTLTYSVGVSHWNPRVHPETRVIETLKPSLEAFNKWRQLGFTTALVVPDSGIFRGQSAVLLLGDEPLNHLIVRPDFAQHIAFEQATWEQSGYPDSLMGAIALIRQTFLDARWYSRAMSAFRLNPAQPGPELNPGLEHLQAVLSGKQPAIFEVFDDLNFLRAHRICVEFNLRCFVRGSGYEYRQAGAISRTGIPILLPLNFPAPPEVETPESAMDVQLQALWHWEAAPHNAEIMMRNGATVALTTASLGSPGDFPEKVREAINAGLEPDAILSALTTIPARLLGLDTRIGTVEPGRIANLIVTLGDLFDEDSKILDVWVAGKRHQINALPPVDPIGAWVLQVSLPDGTTRHLHMQLTGKPPFVTCTMKVEDTTYRAERVRIQDNHLSLVFSAEALGYTGLVRLSGYLMREGGEGMGELPDGSTFQWRLTRSTSTEIPPSSEDEKGPSSPAKELERSGLNPLMEGRYPPVEFGREMRPAQPEFILLKNGTLWTSGPAGILVNADMLIHNGKIEAIGKGLKAPSGAVVVDATGKHITPGLIDAHSHTAISEGVNEAGQAITAEVRISDVINPYDINIYRELAGGLTVAHLLHGSANPIGGQNATIKLRWGEGAEGLLLQGADPTIKFALGENPKQSNWGDRFTSRYPQTRMGMEQIIRDRFRAAVDYREAWMRYNALPPDEKKRTIPPRTDLELEALVEILEGKRKVHAHSYRQDEILMLMRVAEDFGFRIGTFQHILEGFKVADLLASHGAMASTFSDWWSYKIEVYDAIPYNGALMHFSGVVVSFNSDSAELARRLNTESAKAVKYGGVPPEEALKFVTIHPARQLGIADRVGSLEIGKDADFVVWSGNPLSVYSVCEQTWIDGRKYFDREEDARLAQFVKSERARLIQKALETRERRRKKERQRLLEQQPANDQQAPSVAPTHNHPNQQPLYGGVE